MSGVLFGVLMAVAQAAVLSPTDAEIKAMSAAFDDAQLKGDKAVLERMLASDMVFVRGSGIVTDRTAFLDAFTSGARVFEPFVITDRLFLRLGPDAAIAGGKATMAFTEGGKRTVDRFWFADTFARRPDGWKVVYVQVTRLP